MAFKMFRYILFFMNKAYNKTNERNSSNYEKETIFIITATHTNNGQLWQRP